MKTVQIRQCFRQLTRVIKRVALSFSVLGLAFADEVTSQGLREPQNSQQQGMSRWLSRWINSPPKTSQEADALNKELLNVPMQQSARFSEPLEMSETPVVESLIPSQQPTQSIFPGSKPVKASKAPRGSRVR